MKGAGDIWSQPWHALQRDLALGLSSLAANRSANRAALPQVSAASANSWLARAQSPGIPKPGRPAPA
jgi:hypothetical protein